MQHENTYGADRKALNLPQVRTSWDEDDPSSSVPPPIGYLYIQDITKILQDQQSSSGEELSAGRVAEVYKISQADAENLLTYFTGYKPFTNISNEYINMDLHHPWK